MFSCVIAQGGKYSLPRFCKVGIIIFVFCPHVIQSLLYYIYLRMYATIDCTSFMMIYSSTRALSISLWLN